MNYFEGEIFSEKLRGMESTEFLDCTFKDLDLSGVSFKNSKFIDCKFLNCNCSGATVLNVTFRDSHFSESKLVGINWSVANTIAGLEVKGCQLDLCVFQDLDLSHSKLFKSSLKEVDFSGSKLVKTQFSECDLNACVFTRSDLIQADLTSAFNYTIDPNYTKLKNAKFSLPEAISLLKTLEIIIE